MVLMSWCGWRYSEWYRVNFPRYASPPRSSLEALATARCHLRCAPVRMRSAWQRAPASGVQIGVWSLAAVGYRLGLVWATGSVDELGAWCGGRVCAARSTASAPHSLRSVAAPPCLTPPRNGDDAADLHDPSRQRCPQSRAPMRAPLTGERARVSVGCVRARTTLCQHPFGTLGGSHGRSPGTRAP